MEINHFSISISGLDTDRQADYLGGASGTKPLVSIS